MIRFDLLDEYTCVVVPRRLRNGAHGETAGSEASSRGSYAKSIWRKAVTMIALLDFISRESLSDRRQRQVHRF